MSTVLDEEYQRIAPPVYRRRYLRVPFESRRQVKALGARWDAAQGAWYVPRGVDLVPFLAWLVPVEIAMPALSRPRVHLSVPYADRHAAKAAGAVWDVAAGAWYAGAFADLRALERWRDADASGAALPSPTIFETQSERTQQAHEIRGAKALFEPLRKVLAMAELAERSRVRLAPNAALCEVTAAGLAAQMTELAPAVRPTPYLSARRVQVFPGVFVSHRDDHTYLPLYDMHGKLWSMQTVDSQGFKRLAHASRTWGCGHPVGGFEALDRAPAVVLAVDYVSAASLTQCLGFSCIAAIDAANLAGLATALQQRYPDRQIIVAGDAAHRSAGGGRLDAGRVQAIEASRAVNGAVVFPLFAPGEKEAEPTEFVTFNDLAVKSALGWAGVAQQVGCVLERALAKRGGTRALAA